MPLDLRQILKGSFGSSVEGDNASQANAPVVSGNGWQFDFDLSGLIGVGIATQQGTYAIAAPRMQQILDGESAKPDFLSDTALDEIRQALQQEDMPPLVNQNYYQNSTDGIVKPGIQVKAEPFGANV